MPKKKINKSAWIRSQPRTMSAKDIVAKAKAAGIKVTDKQVYNARSSAKKTGGASKTTKRGPAKRKPAASSGSDNELAFRRLVLSIGLPKAEAYISDFKRSVGL